MTASLLLIDNYDSFTWNLAQAFMALGADVEVHRHDTLTLANIHSITHGTDKVGNPWPVHSDFHDTRVVG